MSNLVDDGGRVLVPKDLRLQFGLEPGAPAIVEADGIRLRRATILTNDKALASAAKAIGPSVANTAT